MRRAFYIVFFLSILACSKEELGPQCLNCETPIESSQSSDVLIINEGNFGWGNGSISLYRPSTNTVSNNVFSQANNNVPLGDVVQSANQFNSHIYVVANNSNKIEVLDENSSVSVATITGFNSPRYIMPISNTKAYVTDLYANSIQIVDLTNHSISGNIATDGWTEKMLHYQDTAYVCNMTNNKLLLINTTTDAIIDSILVGMQPNSIALDKHNMLWVLCDGGINKALPQLIQIDPSKRQVIQVFNFNTLSESPNNLCLNSAKDRLYYLNDHVYKMDITATSLPTTPIFNGSSNTFYGLNIAPDNDIYVADAVDYVQNGSVFRLDSVGTVKDQFSVGIIPGNFLFLQ